MNGRKARNWAVLSARSTGESGLVPIVLRFAAYIWIDLSWVVTHGPKRATLIAMLRASHGATIAEIMDATGWQPHTVRGAMSGALKKKLGLEVTSEKVEDRGRVYKLPAA